jgi:hypothetical protein
MHRAASTHHSGTTAKMLACITQHPRTLHLHLLSSLLACITQHPRTLHIHPSSCRHASRSTHAPFTYIRLAGRCYLSGCMLHCGNSGDGRTFPAKGPSIPYPYICSGCDKKFCSNECFTVHRLRQIPDVCYVRQALMPRITVGEWCIWYPGCLSP